MLDVPFCSSLYLSLGFLLFNLDVETARAKQVAVIYYYYISVEPIYSISSLKLGAATCNSLRFSSLEEEVLSWTPSSPSPNFKLDKLKLLHLLTSNSELLIKYFFGITSPVFELRYVEICCYESSDSSSSCRKLSNLIIVNRLVQSSHYSLLITVSVTFALTFSRSLWL